MQEASLGDLFTLCSHPFPTDGKFRDNKGKFVLIGADASFIPPTMVVCEILNSSGEHDSETGIEQIRQVRGMFYSHKTHKYEKHWFKVSEVKKIERSRLVDNDIKSGDFLSLKIAKKDLLNKQVVLKSVDIELNKNKISIEQRNFDDRIHKKNPYLSFLPPVMTVIDVRAVEDIKDNYYKTTGTKKRVVSELELKCKYYNPNSHTFSEEWIPLNCLADITSNFDVNKLSEIEDKRVLYPLEEDIVLEGTQVIHYQTVAAVKEIVFNHYEYLVIAEDIWTKKAIYIDLKSPLLLSDKENLSDDDLMSNRIPNSKEPYPLSADIFNKGDLYEIEYLSNRNRASQRLIYVVDKYPISDDEDTLIVANCFLRKGKVRHFMVSNIKSSRKIHEKIKNQLIRAKSEEDEQVVAGEE